MPPSLEEMYPSKADISAVSRRRGRIRKRIFVNSHQVAMASFLHWMLSSSSSSFCSAFIATGKAHGKAIPDSQLTFSGLESKSQPVRPKKYDFVPSTTCLHGGIISTSKPPPPPPSSRYGAASKQQPSWILGHLAESNILKLQSALHKSQASLDTISKTLDAVRIAAGNDTSKMAGAAEFCRILVEVMEMGQQTDALIAAAYHYCSCITATTRDCSRVTGREIKEEAKDELRKHEQTEEESLSWMDDVIFEKLYVLPLLGISSQQAKMIAHDTAKLKRIETTASSLLPNSAEADILRHLILSTSGDWRALAIRSAACLYRLQGVELNHRQQQHKQDHNSSSCSTTAPSNSFFHHQYKQRQALSRDEVRFCREALHVYSPLASRMGMHRLKNKMDDMAFRLLYPRQYAMASSILCLQHKKLGIGIDMRTLLDSLTAELKELLNDDPTISKYASNILVCGRTKEPLSLWRKILKDGLLLPTASGRKNMDTSSWLLPADAVALRIVVEARQFPNEDTEALRARETALCYDIQQICLKKWKPYTSPSSFDTANKKDTPSPGRFKDYIRHPKPNGYQSLHYTATTTAGGKQSLPFEIQIRSMAMHHVAEVGLAAHFDYKNSNHKVDSATSNSSFSEEQKQHERSLNEDVFCQHTLQLKNNSQRDFALKEEIQKYGVTDSPLSIYLDALSTAKNELTRNVFVFLAPPSSFQAAKIVSLRAGSCIVDAMREGERHFGSNKVRWRRRQDNAGQEMTRRLKNGDVLAL